jgi:hypothetical protein
VALQEAGALEQPAAAGATDEIADVVAQNRAGSTDDDHQPDLELAVAGKHASGDQRRFARNRDASGLGAH